MASVFGSYHLSQPLDRCHVRLKVKVAAAAQHGPAVPVLPSSSMVQYSELDPQIEFLQICFFLSAACWYQAAQTKGISGNAALPSIWKDFLVTTWTCELPSSPNAWFTSASRPLHFPCQMLFRNRAESLGSCWLFVGVVQCVFFSCLCCAGTSCSWNYSWPGVNSMHSFFM